MSNTEEDSKTLPDMTPYVDIDGDVLEVTGHNDYGYDYLENYNQEFIIFTDAEAAGEAARERWADMAENDPEEFTCLVGKDNLVQWALGRSAGPGSAQVSSLSDWLDLHLDCPEEEFASYDHTERSLELPDEGELAEAWGIDMDDYEEGAPGQTSWHEKDEDDWPQWVVDLEANGFDPDTYQPGDLMAANEGALRTLLGDDLVEAMKRETAVAYRHN